MFPPFLSIDNFTQSRPFLFFCCGLVGQFWTHYAKIQYRYAVIPIILCCIFVIALFRLYDRMTWGKSRTIEWAKEVVVITGGSSGLGRVIADTYRMRGVNVAVLDVNTFKAESEEGLENLRFFQCDIGDVAAVQKVKGMIEQELGTPTILINNAGIVNGKPLLSLAPQAIQRNFSVNLISHFHTIQAFLPAMLQRPGGGTIVTISSILGNLGASHLSDYTAAKAGLIAMHTSLNQELTAMTNSPEAHPGVQNIRTILVKPGQLSTPLFQGVETPSSFFGPIVPPVYLAERIVSMIDAGNSGVIAEPFYARHIEWMSVLPYGLQKVARWASGIDKAMSGFGGR